MRIPKQLKIAGHTYKVEIRNRANDGVRNPASCCTLKHIIWIEQDQCQEEKEACLLHEILEIIDYHFGLKLDHSNIVILEAGMYQVLKDNKLFKE